MVECRVLGRNRDHSIAERFKPISMAGDLRLPERLDERTALSVVTERRHVEVKSTRQVGEALQQGPHGTQTNSQHNE